MPTHLASQLIELWWKHSKKNFRTTFYRKYTVGGHYSKIASDQVDLLLKIINYASLLA